MAAKAEALRKRYDYFNQGDLERALDLWTDDFVWDGDDTGLPGAGRHVGRSAAVKVLQEAVSAWDTFELTADEFIEDGDTVVMLGHNLLAKGDRTADLLVAHIWRYRGDQLVSLKILTDTFSTAKLLGLA